MFTQPAPSPPGILPSSPAPNFSSASSGRPSRLRGLSYFRNYTHNHILSRDSNSGSSNSASGRAANPASSPQGSRSRVPLTRTQSEPAAAALSDDQAPASHTLNRAVTNTQELSSAQTTAEPAVSNPSPSPSQPQTSGASTQEATDSSQPDPAASESNSESEANMTRTRSATTGDLSLDMLPTIRFSAFYDARSNRPSLTFSPLSRTLPTGKECIKVGRYSERENHAPVPANTPSAAPVGFKSKVVSRRHCEFWHENGKWFIRDVKSSSGTFLNHIRLSPPGTESKPYPVNDGDIVQLGIDFKGGEEMIFRCVKMRIELNRGWQAKPNTFNVATHKRLRNLTASSQSQDCSICLNAIAPCQSLFVAPCSHTWHFKCIREMLNGPQWPIFICPNCRAAADLDAEVDEPSEDWQQLESEVEDEQDSQDKSGAAASSAEASNAEEAASSLQTPNEGQAPQASSGDADMADATMLAAEPATVGAAKPSSAATSSPMPIPSGNQSTSAARNMRTPSPNGHPLNGTEGPMTPRNDVGPWVFDGSAGHPASEAAEQPSAMGNLDAAASQVEIDAS